MKALVDEVIVGEETTVVAQHRSDDFLLVGGGVLQTVEVVATDGEHHACLIVLFLCVFDVACTVEYLQRGIGLNGEVAEGVAELIDVELEDMVIA